MSSQRGKGKVPAMTSFPGEMFALGKSKFLAVSKVIYMGYTPIWNNRYSLILRYIFTLQVPHLVTKGKISQVNAPGLLFLKNQKRAPTQVPIEDKVIAEDQLSVGAVHLGLLELQVQEETAQAVGTVVVEQQELLQNTEVADTIRIK